MPKNDSNCKDDVRVMIPPAIVGEDLADQNMENHYVSTVFRAMEVAQPLPSMCHRFSPATVQSFEATNQKYSKCQRHQCACLCNNCEKLHQALGGVNFFEHCIFPLNRRNVCARLIAANIVTRFRIVAACCTTYILGR